MKKHVLLTLSVALVSPMLMAQSNTSDTTKQTTQKANPPALPVPAPSSGDSPVAVDGPTTTDEGQTSGAVRSGGNSVGATGNPNTKSAKTRTRSANASDFGSLDIDSDGKITQEELKVSPNLTAKFKQSDANGDGVLNRAEFAKLQGGNTGSDKNGIDKEKQAVTEGSDRTDKDDELNRKLPGQ